MSEDNVGVVVVPVSPVPASVPPLSAGGSVTALLTVIVALIKPAFSTSDLVLYSASGIKVRSAIFISSFPCFDLSLHMSVELSFQVPDNFILSVICNLSSRVNGFGNSIGSSLRV